MPEYNIRKETEEMISRLKDLATKKDKLSKDDSAKIDNLIKQAEEMLGRLGFIAGEIDHKVKDIIIRNKEK